MKIADTLEECLGGGWGGLHGEVVTHDSYRICQLDFVPDLVFDIGANVGTFTRHAMEQFPRASIVAVEPDPENIAHFRKFTDMTRVVLIEGAIGDGEVYRASGAANGSGEVYMTPGAAGYTKANLKSSPQFSPTSVQSFTLAEIIKSRWSRHLKTVVKIDCEGSENSIFSDPQSMKYLAMMDYIAIEIHRYAFTGAQQEEANRLAANAIETLKETHDCEVDGVHFWARLKKV